MVEAGGYSGQAWGGREKGRCGPILSPVEAQGPDSHSWYSLDTGRRWPYGHHSLACRSMLVSSLESLRIYRYVVR